MLQATYERLMRAAAHKRANYWLAFISFIESSVFPIPPDTILIPMVLADRKNAWRAAGICSVASVLGGILGYAIGALLYKTVGLPLLDFYGYAEKFTTFTNEYNEWGSWIVFGAGITPFPYKVITIASGVAHLDLTVFVIASALARGLRFILSLRCAGNSARPSRKLSKRISVFGLPPVFFYWSAVSRSSVFG